MRVIWQQEFLKGKGNFELEIDASSLREEPSQGACYVGFLWLLRRAKMKEIVSRATLNSSRRSSVTQKTKAKVRLWKLSR